MTVPNIHWGYELFQRTPTGKIVGARAGQSTAYHSGHREYESEYGIMAEGGSYLLHSPTNPFDVPIITITTEELYGTKKEESPDTGQEDRSEVLSL